jgi:hypothetical protein
MSGPAEELKQEHVRRGRQLTVREAIPFLEDRDAEAAAMLRTLGPDFLERPIFVQGHGGHIREVKPASVPLASAQRQLTYVRIQAE